MLIAAPPSAAPPESAPGVLRTARPRYSQGTRPSAGCGRGPRRRGRRVRARSRAARWENRVAHDSFSATSPRMPPSAPGRSRRRSRLSRSRSRPAGALAGDERRAGPQKEITDQIPGRELFSIARSIRARLLISAMLARVRARERARRTPAARRSLEARRRRQVRRRSTEMRQGCLLS